MVGSVTGDDSEVADNLWHWDDQFGIGFSSVQPINTAASLLAGSSYIP